MGHLMRAGGPGRGSVVFCNVKKCCLAVLPIGRRPLQDLVDDLLDFVQEYVIPDVRLRHEKHTATQQQQKGRRSARARGLGT